DHLAERIEVDVPLRREAPAHDRDDRVHEEHRQEHQRHRECGDARRTRERARRHRTTVSVHCSIHVSRCWLMSAAGSVNGFAATCANLVNTAGRGVPSRTGNTNICNGTSAWNFSDNMKSTSCWAAFG